MSIKLAPGHTVTRASTKLVIVSAAGLVAGFVAGITAGWAVAPLVAWDTAVAGYVATTWIRLSKLEAGLVKKHAIREDPSRPASDAILIGASVASLAAVGLLLAGSSQADGVEKLAMAALGVFSVITSWCMVHTVYALKYAQAYYSSPQGGIDFGPDKSPVYADFAYVAFTIGMTYQVSDTGFQTRQLRVTALKHSLLAFFIGTVIIATTINLIVGLTK